MSKLDPGQCTVCYAQSTQSHGDTCANNPNNFVRLHLSALPKFVPDPMPLIAVAEDLLSKNTPCLLPLQDLIQILITYEKLRLAIYGFGDQE